MSWAPGDLALCIEAAGIKNSIQKNCVYTVEAVLIAPPGFADSGTTGLALREVSPPTGRPAFAACYFRKIEPDKWEDCEPEFITLLNRIKVDA